MKNWNRFLSGFHKKAPTCGALMLILIGGIHIYKIPLLVFIFILSEWANSPQRGVPVLQKANIEQFVFWECANQKINCSYPVVQYLMINQQKPFIIF
jgi:hypothetical protein